MTVRTKAWLQGQFMETDPNDFITDLLDTIEQWQDDFSVGADGDGNDVTFYGDTSGCYFLWDASEDKQQVVKTSAAITGTIRSLEVAQTMTVEATANVCEALRVSLTADVKTGAWANAIKALIDYSDNGAAHGMAAALCAEMIPPNSSLARGALYALDLEFGCGDSASWGSAGPVAFIKMENWGTAAHFSANAYLLHLMGEAAATGNLLYTNSLKIRIGADTKYLVYGDAEQGLHLGTDAARAALLATTPYLSVYTTSAVATAVAVQSVVISQTMTVESIGNQVEALKVQVLADVKTGAWANVIFAQLDYVDNGLAHGVGSVICAELSLPGSVVTRGTYCAHQIEIDCPASCEMSGNPIYVFSVSTWGDNKAQFDAVGYLFEFKGVASAAANFWYDNPKAAPQVEEWLRVLTPSGVRYLALYDANV